MGDGKKRLIIIDSNALIYRAYHALPPLSTRKGEIVNAVYGFLLVFFKAVKELKPDFVVATFDLPSPTFRSKIFKEYKAKRPRAPDELYEQIPKVKEFLKAFKVPIYEKEGFEADDIIGTIAKTASRKIAYPQTETIILTGDLDALQLIGKNTKVYTFKKGVKDTIFYDEEMVKSRYGIAPEQLVDFRGLKGDPSDNIPGVLGIGEKTAADLIKKFETLEKLYKAIEEKSPKSKNISQKIREKLIQSKEQALFSKFLAKINKDVPIEFDIKDWEFWRYEPEKVKELLKKFEFYSLLNKLPALSTWTQADKNDMDTHPKAGILEEIEKLYKEGVFSKKIYELEKALAPVVAEMEKNGIKIDTPQLKKLSKELEFEVQTLENKIYNLAGKKFNINSPQQLSEVLFKDLALPSAGLKKTPGGVISTSWSELEKLKNKHRIVKFLEEYREFFKLKSGFVDALPRLEGKDGRIHPRFLQLGTATGRFSCSDPNLQNIPIRGRFGKKIRKAFVAEQGFKFVSADYSQMELRIAASISRDNKMIEFFKRGEDVHKMTASQIFDIPEGKVGEKERSLAKTINFGVLYGMSVVGLAEAASVSRDEAKKFIDEYFKKFEGIANYVKSSIETAKKRGFSETIFGRKRFLPEINSLDFRLRQAAERMAINHPIQGSAADIIKTAMIKIYSRKSEKLILQLHDELLFEVRDEKIEEAAKEIKAIMENIVKIEIPLKVVIKTGENWGELSENSQCPIS